MKAVTIKMVNDYKIKQLGYDFAGYKVDRNGLSFHHLIVPKRECRVQRIPHNGYVEWNGAILMQQTSHDYIHTIEYYDRDMFLAITKEMIEENKDGRLNLENLRKIKDILQCFEREYCSTRNKKGNYVIKEDYIRGRVLK